MAQRAEGDTSSVCTSVPRTSKSLSGSRKTTKVQAAQSRQICTIVEEANILKGAILKLDPLGIFTISGILNLNAKCPIVVVVFYQSHL